MSDDGPQVPIVDLVGHTWIIGVDFESLPIEVAPELLIEEKHALEEAI